MKYYTRFLICSFIIFICFFLLPFKVAAESVASSQSTSLFSISSSPANNYIQIYPGNNAQMQLQVRNNTSSSITCSVYARDFIPTNNSNGIKIFEDSNSNAGVGKWIYFDNVASSTSVTFSNGGEAYLTPVSPTEVKGTGFITIAANQTYNLLFTIKVPLTAYQGTHSSIIFVQPLGQDVSGNGSAVQGRLGANLFIDVGKTIYVKPVLKSLNYVLANLFSSPYISAEISNSGHYINNFSGKVRVKGFGVDYSYSLDKLNILPRSTRLVEYKSQEKIPLSLLFGSYNISMVLYDAESTKLSKSITVFYVSPYILVSLAVIIVSILSFILYRKKFKPVKV